LNVLEQVFKDKVATPAWQAKIREIVPSYGTKLNDSPERVFKEWSDTSQILELNPPPAIDQTVSVQPGTLDGKLNKSADAVPDVAL